MSTADNLSDKSEKPISPLRKTACSAQSPSGCEHAQNLLELTLQNIIDAVVIVSDTGTISFCNNATTTLTGQTHETLYGSLFAESIALLEEKTRTLYLLPLHQLSQGEILPHSLPLVLIDHCNKEHFIKLTAAPIRNNEGIFNGAVLILHNVSDIHNIENELFRTRKIESIGLLAAGIAHSFNNILTGIVTNLFMARTLAPAESEIRQLLLDSETAAFRASSLTKQLLSFARGSSPVKEVMNVRAMLEDSVGFCLSGSNVDCKFSIDDDIWPLIVDRGQIDQVIQNLVQNSREAMVEGGTLAISASNLAISDSLDPTKTVYLLPLKHGSYVKISFKDTGSGIAPDDLENIFDPYFSTKPTHAGLGLATVFSIVKKHDGHIIARSIPGVGTTISIYLPAAVELEQSKKLPLGNTSDSVKSTRILIMDDDDIVRMVVGRLLTKQGYQTVSTTHGQAAIDVYTTAMMHNDPFHVAIMDLTIPGGMGGKEAGEKILAIDPLAKIILFSGYSNDPIMTHFQDFGFAGVLVKPFSIDDFTTILNKVLSQ